MNPKVRSAIIELLSKEPFYGHLITKMNIRQDDSCGSAGVYVTSKINLVYSNPFIETLTTTQVAKVLKHECEHLIRNHIVRSKELNLNTHNAHKKFNVACDATINKHDLKQLADDIGGVTVKRLEEMLTDKLKELNTKRDKNNQKTFEPLKLDELSEYYYRRINEFVEDNSDLLEQSFEYGDSIDNHDIWEKSEAKELIEEVIKEKVKGAMESAGGIGNVPRHLLGDIQDLFKSKTNWRKELRQFVVNSTKANKIPTRKKRNRRYGILSPGSTRERIAKLVVCVDTSGSMAGDLLGQVWAELGAISKELVEPFTVVECDCVVQRVYEFKANETPKFQGFGGTLYQPAIDEALKHSPDGILYIGDLDCGDKPNNPKVPFLWASLRSDKKPGDFGRLIKIELEKK